MSTPSGGASLPVADGAADGREPAAPAKRPTMRTVAQRAGVSQTLVSLVFRNAPGASAKTRARILQVADEIGYRPDAVAQGLRRKRSRHLGVLFRMQQPYEVDLVEAIHTAATEHGYHVVLGTLTPGRDQRQAVDELLSYRSEAVILLAPTTSPDELAHISSQAPVVEVSRPGSIPGSDAVRIDDERGAHLVIDHLAAIGHRDIVHIDGGDQPGAALRRNGYLNAMRQHDLADHARVIAGDYTEEAGAAAGRELLAAPLMPTAVFAANDQTAHGLMHVLLHGHVDVPVQVSIVGYDDSRLSQLSFMNLTTVRQNADQLATHAVQAAVERLDHGRTIPTDIVLEPSLIIRGTTAPPLASEDPSGR